MQGSKENSIFMRGLHLKESNSRVSIILQDLSREMEGKDALK